MDDMPIKEKSLNRIAGRYRLRLKQLVDTSDPMVDQLLGILCYQLAVFQDAKANINREGVISETASGTARQHPAINIIRNTADMILRYCERLGIGKSEPKQYVDEVMETIRGNGAVNGRSLIESPKSNVGDEACEFEIMFGKHPQRNPVSISDIEEQVRMEHEAIANQSAISSCESSP